MSEAPPRVRAVARVGGEPSAPAGPVVLVRRRRSGHLGWLGLGQALLAEVVLVTALAVAGLGPVLLLAAAVPSVAVLVLVFGRRQGRWWTERMLLGWRIRQRRRAVPVADHDPRLAALRTLAADLTVSTYEASDGERLGVARDSSGWFAVAAVAQPAGVRADMLVRLPLDRLSQALREMGQPGSVVQVVVHSVPAPTGDIDPRNRCVVSYRELLAQHGPVPADRSVWVAVRVEAQPFVAAWVDEDDPVGQAPAVVAALVRRMGRVMRRDGLAYQGLDADALVDALGRSLDLDRRPTDRSGESWEQWRSATLTQTCFWVADWPAPDRAAAMLERIAATPAAFTSIGLVLDAREQATDLRCLVRVATRPDGLAAGAAAVEETARQFGGRVRRLDGEQAPAVYASAPTGGGAQ